MRADRLLSLLVLLQARGRVTAQALADELEVSVRTNYRDMEALSAAGVPVWAAGGPGGGCQLLDDYRSSLVGISAEEATALLAAAAPGPLEAAGLAATLAGARLKLLAALPAAGRAVVLAGAGRFHVDAPAWFRPPEPVPELPILVDAVRSSRRLRIVYGGSRATPKPKTVDPLGLVSKAGTWYLVARLGSETPVYRASRIQQAVLLDEVFERPDGFDLGQFWTGWSAEFESSRPRLAVTVRVSPDLLTALPEVLGDSVRPLIDAASPPDPEGTRTLVLTFESLMAARYRLLGFGDGLEVLSPEPVRVQVGEAAARTAAVYAM